MKRTDHGELVLPGLDAVDSGGSWAGGDVALLTVIPCEQTWTEALRRHGYGDHCAETRIVAMGRLGYDDPLRAASDEVEQAAIWRFPASSLE